MAIAEMSRLKLAGLTKERDVILNALASTGLAEVKGTELLPDTELIREPERKEALKRNFPS